jgi:hypothetical protein
VQVEAGSPDRRNPNHLDRVVLAFLLLTFIAARVFFFRIMTQRMHTPFLHLGGTHLHPLNHGIFPLAGLGAYLLLGRPSGRSLEMAAGAYGAGMGLTFDESAMRLHLGESYCQRATWDAIVMLGSFFALAGFSSTIRRFRPNHWWTAAPLLAAVAIFFIVLVKFSSYGGRKLSPKPHEFESTGPD